MDLSKTGEEVISLQEIHLYKVKIDSIIDKVITEVGQLPLDAQKKLDRGKYEETILKVVKCSLDFAG